MKINVLREKKDKAGIKTLCWIEEKVVDAFNNGEEEIIVDFTGVTVSEKFIEMIAKLEAYYHVQLEGLGSKEGEVEAYVASMYFLKERLGVEMFVKWFEKRVAEADYPLMILDSRIEKGLQGTLSVIKPLYFHKTKFVYQRLQSRYLEPCALERAVEMREAIWVTESMSKVDIADKNVGLRFACNTRERTMLDIFEAILSKKVRGFA
ncbi:hypothetical protein [Bacillus thuringiensis]|uniref:hypothetical protein n=1 Tax=Bacillus thuringiensis TaxID=1428 RepID=UPI000BFC62F0|nr:hypothetical protein [Bacillus thuringiensis]PGT89947.1 hypothetical protein COD17_09360 [Bacillus thuringiensis]